MPNTFAALGTSDQVVGVTHECDAPGTIVIGSVVSLAPLVGSAIPVSQGTGSTAGRRAPGAR